MELPSTPSAAISGISSRGKAVLLEAPADDRHDLLVDEAPDGVLDDALFVAQLAAHVVEIERVERGLGGVEILRRRRHRGCSGLGVLRGREL